MIYNIACNGNRRILLAFLFPILSLCFIKVLYSNFILSSSFYNAKCVFGIRNYQVTFSIDKKEFETCENFQFYQLFMCAHYTSLATAYLPVGFLPNMISYKFACPQHTESATRPVFGYISKAVQQALLLLSGNVQSNLGPLAASYNINQPALLPVSIVTVCLVTASFDGHCFIHALKYSLATYLKHEHSYRDILNRVNNEATVNEANYTAFIAGIVDSLRSLAKQYFDLRHYNTDFADLLPLIAVTSFQIHIVICS